MNFLDDVVTSKVHVNLIIMDNGETLLSQTKQLLLQRPKDEQREVDINFEWEALKNAIEAIVHHSKDQ